MKMMTSEQQIQKLSKIKSNILILGETGTGKSSLALKIFQNSEFKSGPFVTADLSVIPENLFESTLFGHCRGSFTGAAQDQSGLCHLAENGVLFLDELGELNFEQQKKLLYFLETRKFRQLGKKNESHFHGLIILATNRNLNQLIKEGKFRQDLYYRIACFQISLTPLRHLLNEPIHFENHLGIEKHQENFFQEFLPGQKFTNDCLDYLKNYDWPGNFRQLNMLKEFLKFHDKNELSLHDLPDWMDVSDARSEKLFLDNLPEISCQISLTYHQALADFERRYLKAKLLEFKGRINLTSLSIQINKNTLLSRIKKYGINISELKQANLKSNIYGF